MNRLLSLFKTKPTRFKRYKSFFHELQGCYGYLFAHLRARFIPRKSFNTLANNLHGCKVETLPTMGLILERQKAKEATERLIAKAILQELDASVCSYMSGHILHVHPAQIKNIHWEGGWATDQGGEGGAISAMKVDPQLQQQDIAIWLALQMKFERNTILQTACRTSAVRPRDQDDPHDDAHPKGENSAKRQKTSEYEAYVSVKSLLDKLFQAEQASNNF
ncbi:hypothetical protein Tco_1392266 [Tanacetum coccineum]